ncbi:uncharacterized protein EI97DRAFT_466680 [Westerdykella ornata]|uniref:Glyoxalase-like domain-containing protein n=1 Tax=Westerdykella ornata TaxID=318751 RepID=A0A6A6JLN0_WESOR|nr:uncharacterized protein EI97DRAFT_466680 [Westerdykella ornata]KAF2277154.1 hypothetical protein EI97DRAFT_466680 [Westerdykella ornata]
MSPQLPPYYLDHIIVFLPASRSSTSSPASPHLPPSFLQAFTPYPGGQHADNLTANTLILLQDGSYLELICWVPGADEEKKRRHWWSGAGTGWKDWCLGVSGGSLEGEGDGKGEGKGEGRGEDREDEDAGTRHFALLNRAEDQGGVKGVYLPPLRGGRKRPDGVEIGWSVIFPSEDAISLPTWESREEQDQEEQDQQQKKKSIRGLVPFFCHDLTPRPLRVPVHPDATADAAADAAAADRQAGKTRHPCGALGLLELCVLVAHEEVYHQVKKIYTRLFGEARILGGGGEGEEEAEAVFTTSRPIPGISPVLETAAPRIRLRLARSEAEKEKVRVRGAGSGFCVCDVVLAARAAQEEEEGGVAGTGRENGTRVRIDGVGGGEEDVGGLWVEYL